MFRGAVDGVTYYSWRAYRKVLREKKERGANEGNQPERTY